MNPETYTNIATTRILRKTQTSTAQIRKNPEINITITIRWKISDENTNNTTKNNKDYQDKFKNHLTIKKKFWDKYNKYKLRLTAESAYNPSAPQKIKALDLFGCLIGTLCRFSNQDQYFFIFIMIICSKKDGVWSPVNQTQMRLKL